MAHFDTIVVVPCYNEANRLHPEPFRKFAQDCGEVRLLFVNDGSTDGTAELLDRLQAEAAGRVRVQHLQPNRGKAEAVRQGVLAALPLGPRFIGFLDADLATQPEAIRQFREVLLRRPGLSLVMGARVPLLGHDVKRHPVRRLLSRILSHVVSATLGLRLHDSQCGAKLFRVTPLVASLFQTPFRTGWMFDVEILARLQAGLRHRGDSRLSDALFEYPLESWSEIRGSKVKPADFVRAAAEMAAIFTTYVLFRQDGLDPDEPTFIPFPIARTVCLSQNPGQRLSEPQASDSSGIGSKTSADGRTPDPDESVRRIA